MVVEEGGTRSEEGEMRNVEEEKVNEEGGMTDAETGGISEAED
jgi:hypothetical protein